MKWFFVFRFQRTMGRMIALRRPPAKPPNLPRNPPSGQRPSLSKSVCWMGQTTRLQWRYAHNLYCTHSKFPPDAPSSHDEAAPWQPELSCSHCFHRPSPRNGSAFCSTENTFCAHCFYGSCVSLCRAGRTRQELHACFTPQMPPGTDATNCGWCKCRSCIWWALEWG